ncbi:MAG: antibiotic biosynthesis monooxygenase [Phycisphaerales bacterium]|nr:antibiotic biosynthesis monooxygenase [Phycisphaerae bacterium]NNF45015.1 antibiotic biosynthesis monooxygenase [Phycisphaerales bacterium]NNM26809.1 antibiotic biosynthesis monooxygenase [Phycisphaerales bacterium]
MPNLTIVAHIHAKPDRTEHVCAELEKLIPVTRSEDGCIQYDLHQDRDDPNHFMFYETWVSRKQWQTHMNAPHLAAYLEATEGAVAEFTLYEMTAIA